MLNLTNELLKDYRLRCWWPGDIISYPRSMEEFIYIYNMVGVAVAMVISTIHEKACIDLHICTMHGNLKYIYIYVYMSTWIRFLGQSEGS